MPGDGHRLAGTRCTKKISTCDTVTSCKVGATGGVVNWLPTPKNKNAFETAAHARAGGRGRVWWAGGRREDRVGAHNAAEMSQGPWQAPASPWSQWTVQEVGGWLCSLAFEGEADAFQGYVSDWQAQRMDGAALSALSAMNDSGVMATLGQASQVHERAGPCALAHTHTHAHQDAGARSAT